MLVEGRKYDINIGEIRDGVTDWAYNCTVTVPWDSIFIAYGTDTTWATITTPDYDEYEDDGY